MRTNREIIAAHYDAAAHGDLAGMTADFAPEIRWIEAEGFPTAGRYTGADEIGASVFAAIATDWDGFGMHADELLESGDTVVALGRYRGIHRRTGRALDARAVHVWRLADGAITGFEQIADTRLVADAAEAVGA
ncbi:nuclear transport factor 2 family protein [Agromyces larvae]|uniref:Nuclear transport factor 2 family protein n=1 Tax=Agromyces larvae TaxID=2929802 RepID=A0ABY4BYS4_9MICO|nr:nuclear transport factor 2 family protein [Agromyces larvae]UOE44391.1 nuclear transport factor 2 family protein [Agromyces larvae]